MAEASINNHAGFIWSVADPLRGGHQPSEYGNVILPLTTPRWADAVAEAALTDRPKPGYALDAGAEQASVIRVRRGSRRSLAPTTAVPAVFVTPGSQRSTHRCCSGISTGTAELRDDGVDDAEALSTGGAGGGRHLEPPHRQPATDLGSQGKITSSLWTTSLRHRRCTPLSSWRGGPGR